MNIGVNTAENTPSTAVLLFGDRPAPRPLAGLSTHRLDSIDIDLPTCRRLVVVGDDAELAGVLTRLLRAGRPAGGTARAARRRPPGATDPRRDRFGDRRPGPLATAEGRAVGARGGGR